MLTQPEPICGQWIDAGHSPAVGAASRAQESKVALFPSVVQGLTARVALAISKAVVMPLADTHDLGQVVF